MAVIAVINRKGGSGKSTLATHLAAWFALQGLAVALGDVDRQQSTQTWLRRRAQQATAQRARLTGCSVDPRSVVRPPLAGQHMVLDTPGGLRGFDLARVVMYADAVLMPVCNSAFDRESAADCVAELRTLPRVASGRCRLAAVGMRIDARTKAAEVLRRWAEELDLGFVGVLRDTQTYVRCVEDGLTLFDLAPAKVAQDLAQWQPILDWLAPLLQPAATAPMRAAAPPVAAPMPLSLLREPPPEQRMAASSGTPMHTAVAVSPSAGPASGAAPAALTRERVAGAPPLTLRRPAAPAAPSPARPTRIGRLLGALQIPRFLQRAP